MSDAAPNLTIATPSATEATFIERWGAAVHGRDLEALAALLGPDVVFWSPVMYRPYKGRSLVSFMLNLVAEVLPDLHYINGYANGRGGVVLFFDATVADADKRLELQGVDILEVDDAGLVTALTVMIRPMRCLNVVAEQMMALFKASAGKAGS